MTLLAADGRRGEALRVYAALVTALRDDLDLAPSPETEALRTRLLVQEGSPAAADLPPRDEATVGPTNLPSPPSNFVGREHDQAAVAELLEAHRLVTLTGVGGYGSWAR